jgi:hypothetical protein
MGVKRENLRWGCGAVNRRRTLGSLRPAGSARRSGPSLHSNPPIGAASGMLPLPFWAGFHPLERCSPQKVPVDNSG